TYRNDAFTGKSRFTPTRGPEDFSNVGANVGGTLVRGPTSFSASMNRVSTTITPILHAALPDGTRAETLNVRQPSVTTSANGVVDHAITRDQTLRFGFSSFDNTADNLGVGGFDLPERGFTIKNLNRNFRIQEAGPLGRRTFINTRLMYGSLYLNSHTNIQAPT